jgi:hypothetical protein
VRRWPLLGFRISKKRRSPFFPDKGEGIHWHRTQTAAIDKLAQLMLHEGYVPAEWDPRIARDPAAQKAVDQLRDFQEQERLTVGPFMVIGANEEPVYKER